MFAFPVVAWICVAGLDAEPGPEAHPPTAASWSQRFREALPLVAALAPALVVLAVLNVVRFGNPLDFGYARIANVDGVSVLTEPWYEHGIKSIAYLPRGLYAMLLKGFDFVDDPPWLRPEWVGTAITFTMPAVFWALRAPWRFGLVRAAWLSVALILLPDLLHGASGFAQFGYRFIEDALPVLWLLLGIVVARHGLTRSLRVALAAGVVANVYGMVAIYGLGLVSP